MASSRRPLSCHIHCVIGGRGIALRRHGVECYDRVEMRPELERASCHAYVIVAKTCVLPLALLRAYLSFDLFRL